MAFKLFAILQKYDFSSKSQHIIPGDGEVASCLRYCKSTIFQANHNGETQTNMPFAVVCDTAKVRFFKQITTRVSGKFLVISCLRYCKSTIFQANHNELNKTQVFNKLFAILQKYDFSSKSQRHGTDDLQVRGCLRYCKSTIFQANHNVSP